MAIKRLKSILAGEVFKVLLLPSDLSENVLQMPFEVDDMFTVSYLDRKRSGQTVRNLQRR